MIILIRRWLKGGGLQIVLWVVLIIMALVFLLPDIPHMSRRSATWIATVNGQELMSDTLERKVAAFEEQLQQARRQWGQYADALFKMMKMKLDPKQMALEQMVQEALLDQAAQKLSVQLHHEYTNDKLANPYFLQSISDLIPLYALDSTGINEQALNAHLQRFGLSSHDFNQELQHALKRQFLIDMLTAASYIPSFEIREQIVNMYGLKKFSILTFSLDKLYQEEKRKEVSVQELKKFFDRNSKRYVIPEQRFGLIWKFTPQQYGITVNKEEIEAFYNTHKVKQFAEKPAQVQVRRILFKIDAEENLPEIMEKVRSVREELLKNPDQFAEKAKELSEDSETAKKGGLLPFFSRGTREKEFEKTALLLKQDGDISHVVRTNEGIEILQRVSKKTQTFKPLSQVEDQIRKKIELRSFKEQFLQDMKELLEEGEVSEEALEAFIKKRGGTAQNVGPLAKDQPDQLKLVQKLFRLGKGGLSFYIEDSTGVAVKLTDSEKEHLPAFDTIKKDVEQDLYREQATKQLQTVIANVRKKTATQSMSDITREFGGSIQTVDWIAKSDTKKLEELKNKGIPVESIFELEKVGSVTTTEDNEMGYLIRLDDIKPLPDEIFNEKKMEALASCTKEQVGQIESGFVASLYRNAIINTSESMPFSNEDNAV